MSSWLYCNHKSFFFSGNSPEKWCHLSFEFFTACNFYHYSSLAPFFVLAFVIFFVSFFSVFGLSSTLAAVAFFPSNLLILHLSSVSNAVKTMLVVRTYTSNLSPFNFSFLTPSIFTPLSGMEILVTFPSTPANSPLMMLAVSPSLIRTLRLPYFFLKSFESAHDNCLLALCIVA